MMSASSQLINLKGKQQRLSPQGFQYLEPNFASAAQSQEADSPTTAFSQGSQQQLLIQRSNVEAVPKAAGTPCQQPYEMSSSCLKTVRSELQSSEAQLQGKVTEKLFSKNEAPQKPLQTSYNFNERNPSIVSNINNSTHKDIHSNQNQDNNSRDSQEYIESVFSSSQQRNSSRGTLHYANIQNSSTLNHQSKFFILDQQFYQQQMQQVATNNAALRNRRRVGLGIHSHTSQQYRIPDIKEWFMQLSLDDRVLCLTIIDQFFANSIMRMQSKNNKHGQGLFKLQTRLMQEPIRKNPNEAPEDVKFYLKQDFQYMSLKACISKHKEQFALQSKQIPEKELLEYIRLTYTNMDPSANNVDFQSPFNTITVSPPLVANPQKFIDLVTSIVGSNFLKIPYDIFWDDQRKFFATQMPVWFDIQDNQSLATWIIFYLEISLWVHYLAYVKDYFKVNNQFLHKMIFMQKDHQFINLKNELTLFWAAICTQQDDGEIQQQIGQEIYTRTLKMNQMIPSNREISQLNGGLSEFALNKESNSLYTDNKLMEVLLKNQEPHKFIQELCMMGLSKIDDHNIYLMHQIFVQMLREKMVYHNSLLEQGGSLGNSSLSKNQKKNNKKKQKKQLKKLQEKQIAEAMMMSPSKESKHEEEKELTQEETKQEIEKQELPMIQVDQQVSLSQSEDEEEELQDIVDDFCSNQQILLRKQPSPVNQRNRNEINEILNELMEQPRCVDIVKIRSFYDQVALSNSHEQVYEHSGYEIDEEKEKEESYNPSSSESTDDQNEIFSHQMNGTSLIGLNKELKSVGTQDLELLKNLYSSDGGEFNSTRNFINDNGSLSSNLHSGAKEQGSSKNYIRVDEAQACLTTEKIYKKKRLTQKQRQAKEIVTDSNDSSQYISNFQIIRSSKSFNPNQGFSNPSNNQKKKKKRRSKNRGGPTMEINMADKLNSFMRNITHNDKGNVESDDQYPPLKAVIEIKPRSSGTKSSNNESNKPNDSTGSGLVKTMYIKKGSNSQQQQQEEKKEEVKVKDQPIFVRRDNRQISLGVEKQEKISQAKTSGTSRFDKFIDNNGQNESSILDQSNSNGRFQMGASLGSSKDKRKKPSNSKKGKSYWAGKNGQKKKDNQTASDSQQNIQLHNAMQYMSNQVPLNMGQYDQQFSQMMSSMPQSDYQSYNLLSQLDNYDQLQQLIKDAIMSTQFQPQHSFTMEDLTAYNAMQSSTINQDSNNLEVDEKMEQFFDHLDDQMKKMVKETERRLESVRKERETAIGIIEGIVRETYKSSYHRTASFVGVKMYGSMASGLAIEQSDVDLAVVGLDFQGNKELQVIEMRKLCDQLDLFMKSKSDMKFIDSATIPVIKLQIDLQKVSKTIQQRKIDIQHNEIEESMRYLGVDITFEDNNNKQNYYCIENVSRVNQGIQCISYIKELCMRYPDLKPIVLVLKKLLQNHNLNQPYLGGLNSYTLVLMTSTFLNLFPDIKSMSKNLGELLNYFGAYFDPITNMIKDEQIIKVSPLLEPMTVIDPLNNQNNTTRNAFRIKDIQQVFKKAYAFLTNRLNNFREGTEDIRQTDDVIQTLTDIVESTN